MGDPPNPNPHFESEEEEAADVPPASSSEVQAKKEIQDSAILSLYLEEFGIDTTEVDNFTDAMVTKAERWYSWRHLTRK